MWFLGHGDLVLVPYQQPGQQRSGTGVGRRCGGVPLQGGGHKPHELLSLLWIVEPYLEDGYRVLYRDYIVAPVKVQK